MQTRQAHRRPLAARTWSLSHTPPNGPGLGSPRRFSADATDGEEKDGPVERAAALLWERGGVGVVSLSPGAQAMERLVQEARSSHSTLLDGLSNGAKNNLDGQMKELASLTEVKKKKLVIHSYPGCVRCFVLQLVWSIASRLY